MNSLSRNTVLAFAGAVLSAVFLLLLAWGYVAPTLMPGDDLEKKSDSDATLNITPP